MTNFEALALIFVFCGVIEALVVGGFFGILKLLKIILRRKKSLECKGNKADK